MVIRASEGIGHFLFSKEGVTHGYPLKMVAYVMGILPLIHEMQQSHPGVAHPWYANDAGAGGTSGRYHDTWMI